MNSYALLGKNLLNLSALPSFYENKTKQNKKVDKVAGKKKGKKEKYPLCSLLLWTLYISSPTERTKILKPDGSYLEGARASLELAGSEWPGRIMYGPVQAGSSGLLFSF